MRQGPVLPSWMLLVVGVIGVLLARSGLSMDLLCTVSDAMRTLAMLGVIVFGCVMVFRDFTAGDSPRIQAPALIQPRAPQQTVTMSAQQFKVLLDLATVNATQLAVMTTAPSENVTPDAAVATASSVVAPAPAPTESLETAENTSEKTSVLDNSVDVVENDNLA
jgi:hypothetical protein